ncbi:hypothetical protein GCM10022286_05470 [Gryllotalpicola daejeonensis]|uniref:Integral membrane bound transporter domain-containing protein n=1 Tax=Gryllotalpicola daejeonensis TaxID=993087 RepID=A0ABP7ZF65_9MICO
MTQNAQKPASSGPAAFARRILHETAREFHWDKRAGAQARLLLALKAAIAAGLAWLVAQVVPGAASHYPYYAPLGAVIATGPTVLGGIREGIRTVIGLAVGIGLALLVVLIGGPHIITVPIAVAIAVLAAGFQFVGEGNTWVASAAIFVLLIGGSDPADYSVGYLVQTLLGAAVGVAVNMLILPPLAVSEAAHNLRALRDRLADHLESLAQALEDDDVDGQSWAARLDRLQGDASAVRRSVRRADESRRGNPRALRGDVSTAVDTYYEQLRAFERATFAVTDLTDILGHASPVTEPFGGVDAELIPAFAEAARRVADALRTEPRNEEDHAAARREAKTAIENLQRELDKEGEAHPSEVPMSTAAVVALRNVLVAASPRDA